jgi:hypothetical protein
MIASQLIQPSARAALERYKQRDTSKGMSPLPLPLLYHYMSKERLMSSGGEVQINRFSTDNEDYGIQSNGFESISSCYSLPKGSTGVQSY